MTSTAATTHTVVVGRRIVPSYARIARDSDEAAHYWGVLRTLWTGRDAAAGRDGFPGCNPRSVARNTMDALARGTYDICLKSDGIRYALLLTRRMGSTDADAVALMIDRSRNMYEVEVVAPEDYFLSGTVLEGELVWKQPHEQEMTYLVFDAICVRGERLVTQPFHQRLQRASDAVRHSVDLQDAVDVNEKALETDSIVLVHFRPRITMRSKRFVSMAHAVRLWQERGEAEHRVDGLILQRVDAPYCYGTAWDDSCLKWKDHSSIDLRGPAGALEAVDGPVPALIHDRRVVVDPSRVVPDAPTAILEYHVTVTETEVHLMAIRTRSDKSQPNSVGVVAATVNDVIHAIQPEDLVTATASV